MDEDPFKSKPLKAVWNFVENNDSHAIQARSNARRNPPVNHRNSEPSIHQHQPSTSSRGGPRRNGPSRAHYRNGNRVERPNSEDVPQVQDTAHNSGKYNNRGHPNARGQNSREAPRPQRETFPMNFFQVRALADKDPNEILLAILNKNSGFSLILQEKEIKRDIMAYTIIAVAKAVTSRMRNNVNAMINMVTSSNNNFLKNLTPYLAQCQKFLRQNKQHHLDSLVSLSDFLYKFQVSFRSTASDTIIEVLPLLERTCTLCFGNDEVIKSSVIKKLKDMEEQNMHFLSEYTPKEVKHASQKERLQNRNPPESYRSIPVLPTIDDIQKSCSFLRPNLVKGKYQDTDHYLDVQFRLLREDYVKPLRDGIAEYQTLKKLGKSLKHCKDVKVYPDVHIVKQDFVNGGLVHIAFFNDTKFSKIKWEYSKRFLTGSLLCLSSDDFETMLFATVAKRDTKELVKGLLLLKFEDVTDEVLNISPLRSFVVVETSAYFEAYRHNLDALLDLNEDSLPMKPYIIEVEKNVLRPHYLDETSTYDMRPLLLPLDDTHISYKNVNGDIVSTYDFPDSISQQGRSVRILNDQQWPSASDLNLDASQYAAIKAAVTKEFAVIQGPPGTGKTYVGLRIAQLLLHNMKAWQSERDKSPILVVCYTNHALDQFLEGLMLFTQKIVRVGGRCANEALSKFQLGNLKKVVEENREVPMHLFRSIGHKKYEIRQLKAEIDDFRENAEKSFASVLNETILRDNISPIHYAFLKSKYQFEDDGYVMHDWLNIRVRVGDKFVAVQYDDQEPQHYAPATDNFNISVNNNQVQQKLDEQVESEEEGDIEFIEAQRDINSEEFNDVSFELPHLHNREDNFFPQVEKGWQVQGGKKKLKKYVTNSLNKSQAMSEAEVEAVGNIWNLTISERWRLYKFWLERYIEQQQKKVYDKQLQLRKEFEELCEMRTEEDLHVCQQAHVVGLTTTGAAKYRNIVQHLNPKIVIVEEAAEILESHIVTSLAPNTQHVILIGDHQQLKPSPAVYSLAVQFDLNVSLFERMVKNGMDCHRLDIQHRMRPEIAALLVPHIYTDLKNHESVTHFENIKGINKNVYFITHDHIESSDSDSRSKANQHEAKFLIKLCRYILLQGYEPSQITVLTTYTGQLFALKKLVADNSLLKAVRFTVVDNYQGEENDIILISFVRSNEDGAIGFLKVSNRVCVALSRAKKGLFCIGNFELLVEKSDLWKNIACTLNKNQAIGPSLQLTCQNHPGVSSVVASEKDFDSVPEGGCTRSCEFRLKCGHVCSLMCHPYDMEHVNIRCLKPCTKTCKGSEGHKCKKKCYEECGDCTQKVDKRLELCGHTIKVACHAQNEPVVCTHRCEKLLSCRHLCANICGVACVVQCKKILKDITSPVCGHNVKLECCYSKDVDRLIDACKEPCRIQLSCGHTCKGSCSNCHQGRLHIVCKQPCKRILVCGHECLSKCSKTCPPCQRKCENRCVHSKCPKKCGEPCEKCAEPCEWSCSHKECSRVCGELCDRVPCDEPCPKLLKCKHECIGLCGEPCPSECRICDKEKVTEIFLGSEDEEGARFISVEECKHIFEVSDVTRWMKHDSQGEIQMKTCPRCKVVIRKNLRFGNVVKTCLANIEKVKAKTFGDMERNKIMQFDLLDIIESKSDNEKIMNIFEPLLKTLSASKIRSIQELTIMHNIINFSASLAKAIDFLDHHIVTPTFCDSVIQDSYDNLKSYMRRSKVWLISFMQDDYLTASEQQLQEIAWELDRMKLSDQLLRFLYEKTGVKSNSHTLNLVRCLTKYAPFRETDVATCSADFKKVVELAGGAIINISDIEKQNILQAMGLSRGHWYHCPNGHVYCITECGGAMQESRCNECGAKIGGTSHTLLADNRVATAMDGAEHGAWSDAMNLNNYRF